MSVDSFPRRDGRCLHRQGGNAIGSDMCRQVEAITNSAILPASKQLAGGAARDLPRHRGPRIAIGPATKWITLLLWLTGRQESASGRAGDDIREKLGCEANCARLQRFEGVVARDVEQSLREHGASIDSGVDAMTRSPDRNAAQDRVSDDSIPARPREQSGVSVESA